MAECKTEIWGISETSLDTLDFYWNELMKVLEYENEREEIKSLLHCTTLKGKRLIEESGRLRGGSTDYPARAPLASHEGLKGIWMTFSTVELPACSPYGSRMMKFRVGDIINYLSTPYEEGIDEVDEEDEWNVTEDDVRSKQASSSKKEREQKYCKHKHKKVNRKQQECTVNHKEIELELPLLFFECAHHYGSTQYVRILVIRASDPKVEWCKQFCKQIELSDNPFFEFENGRVWTYRTGGKGRNIVVDVLVVGDIIFDKLREPHKWVVVRKMRRAGFDPILGLARCIRKY